jgi:ATP-dependent DNA helicase RecG
MLVAGCWLLVIFQTNRDGFLTMTRNELLEIITNGENSGVEFKRDDIRPEQLAKEIVAFANFRGGRVLLGVEKDGTISGITRPQLEEWVMNAIFGRVTPQIIPYYEEVEIESGKRVAIVSVERGVNKPYAVREGERLDFFIRMGSESRRADRDTLRRLFQASENIHFETTPVSGATWEHVDQMRIRGYFQFVRRFDELPNDQDHVSWERLLINNDYMVATEQGKVVATVAGSVLFQRKPARFLPAAGVNAAAFRGLEKEYDSLARERFDLPMVALPRKRHPATRGLIEDVLAFVQRYASGEILQGARRIRQWIYPKEVIREALLNGLIHRDWTIPTDLELAIYSDRLEIVSPGALPNTVTVEKMKAGVRVPRNPIIMRTMQDCGYVEAMGMGVRNMVRGMLAHNGTEPDFIETEDRFIVKLWRERSKT